MRREYNGHIGRLLEALAMAKEAIQQYEENRHEEARMMIALNRKAMQANRLGDRIAADRTLLNEDWRRQR